MSKTEITSQAGERTQMTDEQRVKAREEIERRLSEKVGEADRVINLSKLSQAAFESLRGGLEGACEAAQDAYRDLKDAARTQIASEIDPAQIIWGWVEAKQVDQAWLAWMEVSRLLHIVEVEDAARRIERAYQTAC
jgi:hypothetical protein